MRRIRDARGYWRVLLAVCAPISWFTVGIFNLLTPYQLGDNGADNVAAIAGNQDLMRALLDLEVLFLFTFVPGVVALILVCRRQKPVFTAVLGTLGVLGALAGTFNPAVDLFTLMGLRAGIGQDHLAALVDAVDDSDLSWTLLFTLLFVSVGRIAAGVLLWQARVGPRSLAVLMAVSPFIEFGGETLGLGNLAPAAAWIASGVAMLGVSATLWRMPDDDFDLPPVAMVSGGRV